MTEEEYKPKVNVGTIGHVDHDSHIPKAIITKAVADVLAKVYGGEAKDFSEIDEEE